MGNSPTDAELDAVLCNQWPAFSMQATLVRVWVRAAMRDALAKWGTPPAVAGEQVGWMWQHDETGRTGFVDCWQVENGWQENNPRLRLVSKLYTTPQPTQAQAGAVPLTVSQIREWWASENGLEDCEMCKITDFLRVVRAVEEKHGIKGGQHGTDN